MNRFGEAVGHELRVMQELRRHGGSMPRAEFQSFMTQMMKDRSYKTKSTIWLRMVASGTLVKVLDANKAVVAIAITKTGISALVKGELFQTNPQLARPPKIKPPKPPKLPKPPKPPRVRKPRPPKQVTPKVNKEEPGMHCMDGQPIVIRSQAIDGMINVEIARSNRLW